MITPQIRYYDNAIRETDRLNLVAQLASVGWVPSAVANGTGAAYTDQSRTSNTLYQRDFPAGVRQFLAGLEGWLDQVTGRDRRALEGWQAVRYQPGQLFEPHLDPGNSPRNERELTVLITLQQPIDGGHTYFVKHNYAVNSVNNRLLTWENLLADGSIDGRSLHAGLPVVQGEKIILVNWYHQRP